MGCLELYVKSLTISDIICSTTAYNIALQLTTLVVNSVLKTSIQCLNTDVSVQKHNVNSPVTVLQDNKNTEVSVSAGLVCSVGHGDWEVFYVTQGPFIIEQGVFKVKKV